jgi:hypothetical protein
MKLLDLTFLGSTLWAWGAAALLAIGTFLSLRILVRVAVGRAARPSHAAWGGYVAQALAMPRILGDLFASLAIMLDRPFVLGDFLALDNYLGSVERIGLKTTRLRSLSGEQLIFANADLLGSRIRNYGRMQERRVVSPSGCPTPRLARSSKTFLASCARSWSRRITRGLTGPISLPSAMPPWSSRRFITS